MNSDKHAVVQEVVEQCLWQKKDEKIFLQKILTSELYEKKSKTFSKNNGKN